MYPITKSLFKRNKYWNSVLINKSTTGIITLQLNEPNSRNALSHNMIEQLNHHIHTINQDQSSKIVILKSSSPKIFCAGANLKERAAMNKYQTEQFVKTLRNTFFNFKNIEVPTIAQIDGFALGGGLELAMSCDLRVATDRSILGLVETALGIIPGAGGTQNLPRLVGTAKAKELIFTAQKLDAHQACSLGILNYVETQESIDAKVQTLCDTIMQNGPIALKMAKLAIQQGVDVDIKTGLEIERMCYSKILETKDRIEGMTAFNEKRKPVYKGE